MLKTIFCLFALFFWMSGCASDGTVADDEASTGDDSGAAVEEPAEEPEEEPDTEDDGDEGDADPDVACDWTANNGFGDSLENYVCWVINSEGSIYMDNGAPTLADGILTFSAAPVVNSDDGFHMTRLIDLSADTTVTLTLSSVEGGTKSPQASGDMIDFGFVLNGELVVAHRLETSADLSYTCSVVIGDTINAALPCAASMPLYLRLKLVGSTVTAYYGTDLNDLTAFIDTAPADDIVGRSDVALDFMMSTATDAGTFEVRFTGLEITQP